MIASDRRNHRPPNLADDKVSGGLFGGFPELRVLLKGLYIGFYRDYRGICRV